MHRKEIPLEETCSLPQRLGRQSPRLVARQPVMTLRRVTLVCATARRARLRPTLSVARAA